MPAAISVLLKNFGVTIFQAPFLFLRCFYRDAVMQLRKGAAFVWDYSSMLAFSKHSPSYLAQLLPVFFA